MKDETKTLLTSILLDGATGQGAAIRRELALPEGAPDDEVARALVSGLAERAARDVRLHPTRKSDLRKTHEPPPVGAADVSFLGRLGKERGVEQLDELRTLAAVLRAGTLAQRRAAVRRIAQRAEETRGFSNEELKRALETVRQTRDEEIAYELSHARAALARRAGRDDENEEALATVMGDLERKIVAYWDGELSEDPIDDLHADDRALLLVRARDLPDAVIAHVAAIVEANDGSTDRGRRLQILTSLRYAGDPRLVPALRSVLEGEDVDLVPDAARALGRIDDPRVRPALLAAFERSVTDRERTVLAGALGHAGDLRGLSYVRKVLASDDREVVLRALAALESLGGPEDVDRVTALASRSELVAQCVSTLGHIADARALPTLNALRAETKVSSLVAEIEDATFAIRRRMELRGEDTGDAMSSRAGDLFRPLVVREQAPIRVRMSSTKDYVIGHLLLTFGAIDRAIARFEQAARTRARWAAPLVEIAMAHLRRNELALALASFRRAVEADRGWVERDGRVARAMARCFLRRAEEMERDGRSEIARGLLEEALALDLRRAPSALRFEIRRRHEALRVGDSMARSAS